ncbi:hypothetical protein BC938DRAFT_474013 [Jimgerdemannia flammicorona]|uniref:Uncharacterized protein n=1 Tax=Jimgerdemannia flammicorona TaxID=994334 RepID=A0A433QSV0_9FUNG|nr:hypothetical protein BC938DRAFT_474013 [Jimgerdemannia flammicorona]
MNPSTTLRSSASDHLPPRPTPTLLTRSGKHSFPMLANQEYAVFQPRKDDILIDVDVLELFRCAERILKKQPGLAKIILRSYYTLLDHVHFSKKANENLVFFRQPTGRYFVVHPASFVATISAPLITVTSLGPALLFIRPHERFQQPPNRLSELDVRPIRPNNCSEECST